MRRLSPASLLFFVLLLAGISNADDVGTVVHFGGLYPNITLTEFNVTPVSLIQGQTADFSLTMQNTGLAGTTVNATVWIYTSGGTLVDSFAYDPVAVSPSATVIVVKTWDSGSLGAGIYTAYTNATYADNTTNTLNVSFTITSIPPGPSGSSGVGGGGGGGKPKPQPVPPSITPVGEDVQFARVPVLKEMLAGEGGIESFTLINNGKNNISVSLKVEGVPGEWVRLQQNATVLYAGSSSVVNLVMSVPKDVLSGNYLVKIEAEGYGYYARDYMLLRVKNYPKWHKYPVYLKTIRTDILEGSTDVDIRLKNPSENRMKIVTLKETIPKTLWTSNMEINFKNKPGIVETIGSSKVILWNVSDLQPLEEVAISYSLNKVLIDYHAYGTWHLRQMDLGAGYELANLIRVIDLSSETISPGGSGEVTATILYAGEEPLEVTAALETPAGFRADPGYTSVLLIPRGLTNVNFRITAPKDVSQTHLIRAIIMGKEFNVYSSAPIVVRKGSSALPGTAMIIGGQAGIPEGASVSVAGIEIVLAVLAVILGLGLVIILLAAVKSAVDGAGRGIEKPRYDFERVKTLGRIKKVMGKSIRDVGNK